MTDRSQGISGTEVAALFGMSPYLTKVGLYARKKGLIPDPPQTERMKIGKLQEPVVVQLFEDQTGRRVVWLDKLEEHPKESLIIGTPDGYCDSFDKIPNSPFNVADGFESKTAGLDRAHEWGDGGDVVPVHYIHQANWYCILKGWRRVHLAALIGGNDFRTFVLEGDKELQAMQLDAVRKFWRDHIVKDVPPTMDYSQEADDYIRKMYPSPTEGIREASDTETELIVGILQTNKELKFLERRKDELRNQLKHSIGFAQGLTSIYGRVSYKNTQASEYVVKRVAGRSLRVTGKLGEQEEQ